MIIIIIFNETKYTDKKIAKNKQKVVDILGK